MEPAWQITKGREDIVVALMKSVNHSYDPEQIRDILEATVKERYYLKDKTRSGGIIDAGRVV